MQNETFAFDWLLRRSVLAKVQVKSNLEKHGIQAFIRIFKVNYSRLSLSRLRLSRITAYLGVKIWSLFKHENLTTGNKTLWKRGEIAISPLFHNIFNISLTSGVNYILIYEMWLFDLFFPSILQIWYVEERISRSISEGPLDFQITGVDCMMFV